MTYSTILVHVPAGPDRQGALRCARQLADQLGAVLAGVGVQALPAPSGVDPEGSLISAREPLARDTIEDDLKDAERRFAAAAAGLAEAPTWNAEVGSPKTVACRAAEGVDLIVINAPAKAKADPRTEIDPGDLALGAGRPVLIVPAAAQSLDARRVLIAWKDTREAQAAVAAALPILQRAEAVLVLEVVDARTAPGAESRAAQIAADLCAQRVKATHLVVEHSPANAAEILRQAETFGAGLIVAGAYGHSRLAERVFGGVTRHLLAHIERPLLLNH